jgi:6-phosphogluconolactonase (cycloisomerase 2 family)
MIAADPSGKYVYSTDLGLDRIYQYRLDSASGKLTPNDPPFIAALPAPGRATLSLRRGDGLWLINEEASTLTFYHLISKRAAARGQNGLRAAARV